MQIEATFRITTPMFCAGANPSAAQLRLPSFKGVLRFWWRALAWSRHNGNLSKIRDEEDRIFGSTDMGRSRVILRMVEPVGGPSTITAGHVLHVPTMGRQPRRARRNGRRQEAASRVVGEGARYLGYGVIEAFGRQKARTKTGQLLRGCIRAPQSFTVQIRCRGLDDREEASVIAALRALGLLGGMGARTRRGYGSLVLESCRVDGRPHWSGPTSLDALEQAIRELRNANGPQRLPEYTALSRHARHVLLKSNAKEPLELLDLVGREMIRFRSWGRNGTILGKENSEKNFQDDHDLMKLPAKQRTRHPRRIAFGLPHNYGKEQEQQVVPFDEDLDRRASPLFIHIHQLGDLLAAVVSFLPAHFLPASRSDISVGRARVPQLPEPELYRPIHAFLDRLLDPKRCKEGFVRALPLP